MEVNEALSQVRSILTESPTTNRWWNLIALAESVEQEQQEMLFHYLAEHIQSDEQWKKSAVPCGDWKKRSKAWSLSSNATRKIELLTEPSEEFPIEPLEIEMNWCPPGTFLMGAKKRKRPHYPEEHPQTEMTLTRGFWIMKTLVTQSLWEFFMENNPSYHRTREGSSHCPVDMVSWYDAVALANTLSEHEGREPVYTYSGEEGTPGEDRFSFSMNSLRVSPTANGYRLPTEAEWEYACRAGCSAPRYGSVNAVAWHNDNAHHVTQKVGTRKPNAWGLYDVLGNVWEWVYDGWSPELPGGSQTDHIKHRDRDRIFRGGSSAYTPTRCLAHTRNHLSPDSSAFDLGFRLVCFD